MPTKLKFEFDCDEVLEGIKQGIIREFADMDFDIFKDEILQNIKNDVEKKLGLQYSDVSELKRQIKEEIKAEVFKKIMKDVHENYRSKFEKYIDDEMAENETRVLEMLDEIKADLSEKLYDELYSEIRWEVREKVSDTVTKLADLASGNTIKIQGSEETILAEKYKELLKRDKMLRALEAGGVDNWEWYDASLSQYYNDEE